MISYNDLFQDEFQLSQLIDEKFVELINNEGVRSAIRYLKSLGATWLDMEHYEIKYRINKWTQNDLIEKEKLNFLKELSNLKKYFVDVNISYNPIFKTDMVTVKTTDGDINTMPFSYCFPEIKERISYIESSIRYGKCFECAYYISLAFPIDNNLVTGYIFGYSDKSRFLHSFVEVVINEEKYVIDGTLNAIFNKEGYYRMQHLVPVAKINSNVFREDLKKYPIIDNVNIPLEVYYVFRDEI